LKLGDRLLPRGGGSLIRQHEALAGQLDKAATHLAETDRQIRCGFSTRDDSLLVAAVSGPLLQ
jgi:hypothetical protein